MSDGFTYWLEVAKFDTRLCALQAAFSCHPPCRCACKRKNTLNLAHLSSLSLISYFFQILTFLSMPCMQLPAAILNGAAQPGGPGIPEGCGYAQQVQHLPSLHVPDRSQRHLGLCCLGPQHNLTPHLRQGEITGLPKRSQELLAREGIGPVS